MRISELIEALTMAQEDLGDVPVTMGWTDGAQAGPVVAFKLYPGERVELRCEREAG